MKKHSKLTSFILIILFGLLPLLAQDGKKASTRNVNHYSPKTGIRAAYLGSIIYPGFIVGVERPYRYIRVDKIKPHKTKTLFKERYLSYSFGMYHQSGHHTNFLLQSEWVRRRQKSKGLYYESLLGAGLSRTFVNGAAYTVNDDGQVEKAPLSGNYYAITSLGAAIGYNANMKKEKPYSFYLKHQWLVLFPHNSFLTLRPTIEVGLNYNLSGFWVASPTFRMKEKQRNKSKK